MAKQCEHKKFIKNEDGHKECKKCGLLESTILNTVENFNVIICDCGNKIQVVYEDRETHSDLFDATYTTYYSFNCDVCGQVFRKITNRPIYV